MRPRLAFIVSHPIQYYVPLYQRLAKRDDISIKVFFTWHDGSVPVLDRGFGMPVAWDIPLNQGYGFEQVANTAAVPGTHHFFGLRNPSLIRQVLAWNPTAVHITGWAWWSHLQALYALHRRGVPTLFRGDSHLLSERLTGMRWVVKRAALSRIYRWPTAFLATGQANQAYYKAFGVEDGKITICPHSIDYPRFAEPAQTYEQDALRWRTELGIGPEQIVLLFVGKFEPNKAVLRYMKLVERLQDENIVAVMVGGGALQEDVDKIAGHRSRLFRVLPFQNQSRMPIVYRLGDIFVLPSVSETWGVAVNEALACSRPVIVSDKVGCAPDVIDDSCGYVISMVEDESFLRTMRELVRNKSKLENMRPYASAKARHFDVSTTESILIEAVERLHG